MADLRNVPRWNQTCDGAAMTTDGPVAKGSRFHLTFGKRPATDVTITQFDRPARLEIVGTSPPMDVASTYTFTEVDGATLQRGGFDVAPKGVMKVVLRLVAPIAKRDLAKHHRQFVSACESMVAAPAVDR